MDGYARWGCVEKVTETLKLVKLDWVSGSYLDEEEVKAFPRRGHGISRSPWKWKCTWTQGIDSSRKYFWRTYVCRILLQSQEIQR